MEIIFYYNSSSDNTINKTLNDEMILDGSLRDSSEVIHPEIMVKANSVNTYNYLYIPEFNRFYYIREITSYRTGLWIVKCEIDVLHTYAPHILNLQCIIDSTEVYMGDNYLNSESWVTKVKAKTDILNFQNGLLNNGEYILITSGGGS